MEENTFLITEDHWITKLTAHIADNLTNAHAGDTRWQKLDTPVLENEPESSFLRRTIRGFITQFIHQTEAEAEGCRHHYVHGIARHARGLKGLADQDFANDCTPALMHAAAAMNGFIKRGIVMNKKEGKDILSAIIKASIDGYMCNAQEMYPDKIPMAGVPKDIETLYNILDNVLQPRATIGIH